MEQEVDKPAKIIWNYMQVGHRLQNSDAIIVMGSMDLRVAERAAELWNQQLAPIIVTSGGLGRRTGSRWTISEARKFAEIMIAKGVPKAKILVEDKSTNSGENIEFALDFLNSKNIHPKQIILVTKPYMERRAYATARKLFPSIKFYITSPQIKYENYPTDEIPKELFINIMVGDLQRLKIYPKYGFSIAQSIPESVEQSMVKLTKLGYDKQLVK